MKKMVLILFGFLLTSCSLSSQQMPQLEENPVLTITLPSPSYALALRNLWNEQYPQQANALKFQIKESSFHQQFQTDIEWVKDSDAIYKREYAMHESYDDAYPFSHFQRKELEGYFQPVEAKGLLYSYSQPKLDTYHLLEEQLQDFSVMNQSHMIYYSHAIDQVLPYWLSEYQHDETDTSQVFMDDTFLSCIENMIAFYKEHDLEDDPYISKDFYASHYMSGLISTSNIQKHPLYQAQELHFLPMPSTDTQTFSPFADIYGFMVCNDCKYKESAKAFMNMVRSKKGIQAYLDAEDGVAVLDKDDIKDFSIYDSLRKEMIIAMNDSQMWDISVLKDKPSIRYKDLYEKTEMVSILQNGIVADKSGKQIQKEIHDHVIEWISKQ